MAKKKIAAKKTVAKKHVVLKATKIKTPDLSAYKHVDAMVRFLGDGRPRRVRW